MEVKDRPSGKLRSLHIYRETYKPSWSVVFHSGKAGVLKSEKIVFLPLYFAGAFAQSDMDDKMERFDDLRVIIEQIATDSQNQSIESFTICESLHD